MVRKLLIIAALCVAATAQMQRYDSQATATTGQPGSIQLQAVLPGSTAYACTGSAQPCAAPGTASLFSDIAGTAPIAQPLVADASGRFGFFWSGATITLTITPPTGSIGSVQSYTYTSPLAAQQISVATPSPYPPGTVSVVPVGTTGSTTYYYWVVSNFTIGNSAPSVAAVITNAAGTLSSINYDKVTWTAATGANTYDVLRTTTATAPSGACGCAVDTAVSALTASDQSNSLNAYTVATYSGDTVINMTNKAVGAGEMQLSLSSASGSNFSLGSPVIEQVRYADQFSGADMGAKVTACLADLPATGGICDARAITGAQSAAMTITVGSATKPEILLLGPVTLTSAANPAVAQAGQSSIYGVGGAGPVANPAAATLIKATASGATALSWAGSSGTLTNVGLESSSGDALDLVASGSTSILGNYFLNDSAKCDQHTANQAVLLSAGSASALVSFNQFVDLRTYDCLIGVHFATSGTQGPTDNQFMGGQITKSAVSGDGFDFSGAGTAANNIYGMDIAENAIGARLETGTASNKFDGAIFESNTKDTQIDSGSADNQFIYGGGSDGNTDAGLRTTYLGGEWAGGPNGSNLSTLPGAFSQLQLNSVSGEPTTITGSAATPGVALTLPPLSGAVLASGNCFGCNWAPGSKQGLSSLIEISSPNTNTGYAVTLDGDSTGRALFLASQGFANGVTGDGIAFLATATTATIQCGKNGFAAFDACNFSAAGISIGGGTPFTGQTGTGGTVVMSAGPTLTGTTTAAVIANGCSGITAAMTAGTITITPACVTGTRPIHLTHATAGGTLGILSYTEASASIVITSSSNTDTSTVSWGQE